MASLRRAPVQLKEGISLYLRLAKSHPDVHPAVLAAILARPTSERRALLEAVEAVSKTSAPDDDPHAEAPLSDSDEVWEDAVEELEMNIVSHGDDARQEQKPRGQQAGNAESLDGDVDDDATNLAPMTKASMEMLQREADRNLKAWQQTRQLQHWTRYTECRKVIADRRDDADAAQQRAARWSRLQREKEAHEQRLQELTRRRERLRWTKQYYDQTRVHHRQLERARLQEELRQLEERQEARRQQHQQRVDQLLREVADEDERQLADLRRSAAPAPAPTPTPAAPASSAANDSIDEFTHVWDDFSHWEKMVDDDDKENVPPKQPDVIPLGAMATADLVSSASVTQQPRLSARRGRGDLVLTERFEERKRLFEEALLAWHAQDDDDGYDEELRSPLCQTQDWPHTHTGWSTWGQSLGPACF